VWAAGLVAALVAGASTAAKPLIAPSTALLYGAPVLGVLWGTVAWQEFRGSTTAVKMMILATVVVYAAGLALISLAPVYASK
jgi:cytochrome c-type biogenesis protein CcmH/NrfF